MPKTKEDKKVEAALSIRDVITHLSGCDSVIGKAIEILVDPNEHSQVQREESSKALGDLRKMLDFSAIHLKKNVKVLDPVPSLDYVHKRMINKRPALQDVSNKCSEAAVQVTAPSSNHSKAVTKTTALDDISNNKRESGDIEIEPHQKKKSKVVNDDVHRDAATSDSTSSISHRKQEREQPPLIASLQSYLNTYLYVNKDERRRRFQLRCWDTNIDTLRVLLVDGTCTLFALNKYIALALDGQGRYKFDPTITKGKVPLGSYWCIPSKLWKTTSEDDGIVISANTQKNANEYGTPLCTGNEDENSGKQSSKPIQFISEKNIKVCQLLRDRGDRVEYHMPFYGFHYKVTVVVDGIKNDCDRNGQNLPMLVGADDMLDEHDWHDLNYAFQADRQTGFSLVSSKLSEADQQRAHMNTFRKPLFDNAGARIVWEDWEGYKGFEGTNRFLQERVGRPFVE